MNPIKRNIPNSITCLNVVAGTFAILASLQSDCEESLNGLNGLEWAWLLVGVAAVADFCDGLAARALGAYSALGKELDSLCDLVSFGVAPAMITYQTIMHYGADTWAAWLTPLIAVSGALRLARFNVSPENNNAFTGLPIPANAIFWIGATAFLYDYYGDTIARPDGMTAPAQLIVAALILLISLLMISGIRMFSLKAHNLSLRDNYKRIAIIIAAIILVAVAGIPGLAWTMALYIGLCLILPAD